MSGIGEGCDWHSYFENRKKSKPLDKDKTNPRKIEMEKAGHFETRAVVKAVCKMCRYWTRNKNHKSAKCYTNSCPAKQRDRIEQQEKKRIKLNKPV